jgi:hypothetical protein
MATGGDAPKYIEPVQRPEGLPDEAVFNPYTNEYYDSREARWDIELRRYVPLENTDAELEVYLDKFVPVYNQNDWINDHQGTTDPVELALIEYYQANSAYRETHPETMARSDWGIDFDGEFSIITDLGVTGLPGLLKEVNGPFQIVAVVAIEDICKMRIGGISSFTDDEMASWKNKLNMKSDEARKVVSGINENIKEGNPVDDEEIQAQLGGVGIFALPYFYDDVIDNGNDALLKYAGMVLPEAVMEEFGIAEGSGADVLKEALASCPDEIEIITSVVRY